MKTLCLIGTIVSSVSANSLALFHERAPTSDDDSPASLIMYEGGEYWGRPVSLIEARRVCIGKVWYNVGHCVEFQEERKPKFDSYETTSSETIITQEFKDYYAAGDGLRKTLMSASSELLDGIGFMLTDIEDDSVFIKLGIQNGDVICSINGIKLLGAFQAIKALKELKAENAWDVLILRDGALINKHIYVSGETL